LLTKPRKLPKGVHIQYGDSTEVHVADSVANVSVSQLVLKDVLLVPNSALRLISVSRLCRDESLTVQFNEYRGTLTYRYGKTIEFKQINGLYFVQSFNDEELTIYKSAVRSDRSSMENLRKLHEQYGHCGRKVLEIQIGHDPGTLPPCAPCGLGKGVTKPHRRRPNDYKATEPLEIIHGDIVHAGTPSIDGYRYSLNFADEGSDFFWTFDLRQRSEVKEVTIRFIKYIKVQYGRYPKTIQGDSELSHVPLEEYGIKFIPMNRMIMLQAGKSKIRIELSTIELELFWPQAD
jgi:hypothetical protein